MGKLVFSVIQSLYVHRIGSKESFEIQFWFQILSLLPLPRLVLMLLLLMPMLLLLLLQLLLNSAAAAATSAPVAADAASLLPLLL